MPASRILATDRTDAGFLVSTVQLPQSAIAVYGAAFETIAFLAGDEVGAPIRRKTEAEARLAHARLVAALSGTTGLLVRLGLEVERAGVVITA